MLLVEVITDYLLALEDYVALDAEDWTADIWRKTFYNQYSPLNFVLLCCAKPAVIFMKKHILVFQILWDNRCC